MNNQSMLKYFINILILFTFFTVSSQEKVKDTTKYKDRYGLRVGADIYTPVYSVFDSHRKGFEIVADYRVSKRFWAAAEGGYIDNYSEEDYMKFTSNGSFIKIGADFNAYKNWPGLENMIVVGLRYGFSVFDQTLNEYTINADPFMPPVTKDTPITYSGLTAQWIEASICLKVEVIHNIYFGMIFSGKHILSVKDPDNFKTLFVPGFNRVYVNDFGFGFSYTISYLIPFYRK
jgi:hypothetical protein